ncbi:uncharacterized protein [Panulirus ornatus]|uniref:uncharacterized protein isoform X1 n=1 Tax=Panulirus ornatus TaxID=150431 RepID=UPI003A85F87F
MQVHILRWVLFLTVATTLVSCIPKEKKNEELPKPEGWRTRPHQFGSRPNIGFGGGGGGGSGGGGGGSGGDGGVVNPSYDLSEAYNSMAASRMGGGYINTGSRSSSSNTGFDKAGAGGYGGSGPSSSASSYYGSYAPSGYGGYASESGYGLSCASGYVNASAVALLAFLFLLNIVQDVVQQITGRRKREAEEESDVFSFVHNGGLGALKEGLPEVVLPLMVELVDGAGAAHCLQRPLCEANAELTVRYGVVGRVVASLLSNVVSKAFSGDDLHHFHQALEASSAGRAGLQCSDRFPRCSAGHQVPLANITSHQDLHHWLSDDQLNMRDPGPRGTNHELFSNDLD